MTPTALVRAISPHLAQGELTFRDREPVDVTLAQAQHAAYCDVLRELGRRVVALPPADDLPDGVFVEDTMVVASDLAVLTRPGAASRRPEVDTVAPVLQDLGMRMARISAPATLDGGDVLQIGDLAFVGVGRRTNTEGAAQLGDLLRPLGSTVIPVAVTGCLHLKSGVTALPDGSVIAVPEWLDTSAFAGREVIPAPEHAGADVLLLDDTVVLSAAAPRTAELMRGRGHPIRPVDLSELEKLESGPTCPSVLLDAPR